MSYRPCWLSSEGGNDLALYGNDLALYGNAHPSTCLSRRSLRTQYARRQAPGDALRQGGVAAIHALKRRKQTGE
jgi:hypothetical protein